jgi:hypothetical protein
VGEYYQKLGTKPQNEKINIITTKPRWTFDLFVLTKEQKEFLFSLKSFSRRRKLPVNEHWQHDKGSCWEVWTMESSDLVLDLLILLTTSTKTQ